MLKRLKKLVSKREAEPKDKPLSLDLAKKELSNLETDFLRREEEILNRLSKEDRIAAGHPIKTIKHLDRFTANGANYVIRTSLAISRFEEFEKLEIAVTYSVGFENLFSQMRKAFDYINGSEPANAAVVLYNMMNGIKDKLDERRNPVLLLCSLFICREGEDATKYDLALNLSKITDWEEEGIAMESFFSLAFNLVNGFTPRLKQVSENTLMPNLTKKAKRKKAK